MNSRHDKSADPPCDAEASRFRLLCGVVCWLVVLAGPAEARAETWSVMQFNEKIHEWKADQKLPPPLNYTVEGRVSLFAKDRLRLLKCDVQFVSKADLPEMSRRSSNIEVTGKIQVDPRSGEYTFEIGSAREVASDVEKFHELRRGLRQQPAEKWYALGRWAEARAEFYKDHELSARGAEAFLQGLEIERKELARDNPQGLLALAEKAKTFGLSTARCGELSHDAFLQLWKRSQKLAPPALDELAKTMAKELGGCTEPLAYFPGDLWKKYLAQPRETYAAADAATRRKIHRLLYCDILMRKITSGLAVDGSNGFEIAGQIDALVREQHAKAEEYRDKALASRASEIDKLSRSQVLDLAEQYRLRTQPKQADALVESWLTLRLRALDPDDTEGLLDVTDDYRRLMKRQDVADRLLIEGWKRNHKAADIVERLEELGYRLFEGAWLSDDEYSNRPEGQLEKSIRDGRVELGMSPSNVRRALGEPASQARAVTSGQVTEVLTYSLADGSRLIVRLVKRAGQKDPSVVDVVQHRAR